jgi:hypothetical protein
LNPSTLFLLPYLAGDKQNRVEPKFDEMILHQCENAGTERKDKQSRAGKRGKGGLTYQKISFN